MGVAAYYSLPKRGRTYKTQAKERVRLGKWGSSPVLTPVRAASRGDENHSIRHGHASRRAFSPRAANLRSGWLVSIYDDAAVVGFRLFQFHSRADDFAFENRRAIADNRWIDKELDLVDKAFGDQRRGKLNTTEGDDVLAFLPLQILDFP